MTREQQKFYDIKTTTDYRTIGEDIDYKIYADDTRKEVVLQFEETDSQIDWLHNFQFLPWPLKLTGNGVKTGKRGARDKGKVVWTTKGYACAYKSTQGKPVEEFLEEAARHLDYKLAIRGWSFGSAMAKIAARHIIFLFEKLHPEYTIDELTTYGDVKCWLNPFYSATKQCRIVHEYTTPNDLVSWWVFLFHRDRKCSVGPRLKIREMFRSEWYHKNYETYDYSKYEEELNDKGL